MCAIHPVHAWDRSPVSRPRVAESNSARPGPPAIPAGLGRRAFLGLLGGGALALFLPAAGCARSRWPPSRGTADRALGASSFARRLPIPRELRGADITIPIREAEVQILPGRKTRMWTYGGTFPGPTIRRPAGQRTKVTFEHQLPARGRGAHRPPARRPQPLSLRRPARRADRGPQALAVLPTSLAGSRERKSGNDLLIRPGARRTYVYDLMENGAPERAAFQWYHDHRLDRVAKNVWHGLAGMWILDDDFDRSLPLPKRRARHPADGRRPLLRPRQPAHRPVHRPPAAQRRRRRSLPSSSTAPTCRTTTSPAGATGCGCSTSPTSTPTTSRSPTARR